MADKLGRVLIVAGSDSSGGAGIQADIKTVTALGGYAMTAVTAVTVQDTQTVHDVHALPPAAVIDQMRVVIADIGVDCIKTGMLGGRDTVEAVAGAVETFAADIPLVVDPVMVSKSGALLLAPDGVDAVRDRLVPSAALLTPNAPEAAALTGLEVEAVDGLHRAGDALLQMGARAVLMKGGHLPGDRITDVLMTQDGEHVFEDPRISSTATHGTGCTLASAAAAGVALGLSLATAISVARTYVREAIRNAPGFGAGAGPMDHGWPLRAGVGRGRDTANDALTATAAARRAS